MWVCALLLAAAVLAAMEGFWRSRGFVPSVTDDMDLWCCARDAARDAGSDTVALLGASRVQVGFVHSAFLERCPGYRIVNLAIDGQHPMATLKDLADDDTFRGVVICGCTASSFLPERLNEQQDWVEYYHGEWTPNKKANRLLETSLQQRFAILCSSLSLDRVFRELLNRRLPAPPYIVMYPDRSRIADYCKSDIERVRAFRLNRAREGLRKAKPVSPKEWLDGVLVVESSVRRIQQRGGVVVFVRYVTTGEYHALAEQAYPKARFWDMLARFTSATTIHFEEVPSLSGFECPEGSHLDYRDAIVFTKALADELVRRGVVASHCLTEASPAQE